jgi:hypothetical protein
MTPNEHIQLIELELKLLNQYKELINNLIRYKLHKGSKYQISNLISNQCEYLSITISDLNNIKSNSSLTNLIKQAIKGE